MKKTTQYLFLLLFVVAISGCLPFNDGGNGLIMDYANISLKIDLTDSEGHPLIIPKTKEGEAYLSEVYIKWNDRKFYCEGEPARDKMRANRERYHALTVSQMDEAYYVLEFGEFQPNYFDPQLFTLHLPGEVERQIEMRHYTSEDRSFVTKIKVDGKEVVISKNRLLRIELSEEEIARSGYDLKDTTPAPVTLYFRFANPLPEKLWQGGGEDKDKEPTMNEATEHAFSALWRGRILSLEHRAYGTPIDKSVTEPKFYYGTSYFVGPYPSAQLNFFLALGPLSEEKLKEEPLTIRYSDNQSFTFLIDYKQDSSGAPLLTAKRVGEGEAEKGNINYFRNGIIITIPIEW